MWDQSKSLFTWPYGNEGSSCGPNYNGRNFINQPLGQEGSNSGSNYNDLNFVNQVLGQDGSLFGTNNYDDSTLVLPSYLPGPASSNHHAGQFDQSNNIVISTGLQTPPHTQQHPSFSGNGWVMEEQQIPPVPKFDKGKQVAQPDTLVTNGLDWKSMLYQNNDDAMLLQQFYSSMQPPEAMPCETTNVLQQQQQEAMLMQQQEEMVDTPNFHAQEQQLPQDFPLEPSYVAGSCVRRLGSYLFMQQNRPENSIYSWRRFVSDFFVPEAKMRHCFSVYGKSAQSSISFTKGMWQCSLCDQQPGYGYEIPAEVLPRIFKKKYENGVVRELMHLENPKEHQLPSGEIVLQYENVVEQTVYETLHVARNGNLRITFTPQLKICSWEFCATSVEHLIPQSSLLPRAMEIGAKADRYHDAEASASLPPEELNNHFNDFVVSVGDFAKDLEVPHVNDVGYTKPHVQMLEMLQVFNAMRHTIDQTIIHGTSPIATFLKLYGPDTSSAQPNSGQQPDENQQHPFAEQGQTSYHNAAPRATTNVHEPSSSNVVANVNNNQANYASSPYAYPPESSMTPHAASTLTIPPQTYENPSQRGAALGPLHVGSAYALGNVMAQQSSQQPNNETNQGKFQSFGLNFYTNQQPSHHPPNAR